MNKPKLLFIFLSFFLVHMLTAQEKNDPFSELDKSKIETGFLYDRVKLPVSNIGDCNGIDKIMILNRSEWRDIYSELAQSSLYKNFIDYTELKNEVKPKLKENIFQIGILNFNYNAFKEDALKNGLISVTDTKIYANTFDIYDQRHVFAVSPIDTKTYTGMQPIFEFPDRYYFSNCNAKVKILEVDFDNGEGFKNVNFNDQIKLNYPTEGKKHITIKLTLEDGVVYKSVFELQISNPKMPAPNETWTDYTASIAYNGVSAKGDVAVFFGNGNTDFTRPVIIVDGFDPGDARGLSGLWDLANQQNMVQNVLAEGYDFVIVNFYGGDDYIQRNAFLIVKLLQDITTRMINAGTKKEANQIVVIGPSMGGLITRYAITYMEKNNLNHNVRNWISFDSPMRGADIPLGLQHWVRFFAVEVDNSSAQEALEILSGPAAKQMLLYHYTATSGSTANSNALFNTLFTELNVLGFPQQSRIVSIINGDGYGNGQGFNGGNQIINYSYRSFVVDVDGNVWAVPNAVNTRIFNGLYDTALPFDEINENIYVNNTKPYDGAPGGYRSTLKEMDDIDPGYGNIIAPWDNHAFIPTISSLCIQNPVDPYYNVNDHLGSLITPFDKLYYPSGNQEHVQITPESYTWFYHEVINFPPAFITSPDTFAFEDLGYIYFMVASDQNEWNSITYEVIQCPDWLEYNPQYKTLFGFPQNEDVGENYVSIKVSDGLDDTFQNFTIHVSNTNDPPVITSNPILSVNEDDLYTYTITAADEDPTNDVLTFSTVLIPDWLSFDPVTGILSGTPLNDDVGTHNISLRVNDGTVNVDQNFTITVLNTNDAPVFTSEPILSANEDNLYSYTVTAMDVDPTDDILSFSAELIPSWLNFDAQTGALSGTPLNEHIGIHEVILTVSDGTVDVDQSFTITVGNTNDPPVITSEPILSVDEDSPYTYTLTAEDEDPIPDELIFSTVLIPDWLIFDPLTGILSGTPLNEDVGQNNIILRVNDGTADVDQNFTITVVNTNDAPVFTSNPVLISDEDNLYSYTATATDEDPINDLLTFSAVLIPDWLTFDPLTGILSGTPLNNDVGNHDVTLRVNDGTVDVDQSFTITVLNTNDPPVITSEPILSVDEDSPYTYTLTAVDEDPSGDVLILSAVLIPDWLSFDPETGILSGTPLNENVGQNEIVLRVNDGTTDVDQTFTITVVNTNDPPVITSEPILLVYEDNLYTYTLTVVDGDPSGDVLILSAVLIPGWLSFDPQTGILSGTPLNEDVAAYDVTLRVNDGYVDVDQSFTITVINTNDAPFVSDPLLDQNTFTNISFNYSFDVNTFDDPDVNDLLTYSALQSNGETLPAWLSFNPDERHFYGMPTEVGETEIVVFAEDMEGAITTDTFVVYVAENISVPDINKSVLSLYPNPAHDRLLIDYAGYIEQVVICNSVGKVITIYKIDCEQHAELKLNLPPGLYILKFVLDSGMNVKKIFIQ